jgi:hypothetical protein
MILGMEAHQLGKAVAAGRVLIGAALISAPERLTLPWIGRDARRPGAQVLARALGARDVVLGSGALASSEDRLAFWLAAGAVADAVDFAATVAAGDAIPLAGRVSVGGLALGGAVLGVVAVAGGRR